MRSRPRLNVTLSGALHPGRQVVVHVGLQARTETPIEGVDVSLEGKVSRYSHSTTVNDVTTSHHETAKVFDMGLRIPGRTLAPGKHDFEVGFDLPATLPPTFRSRTTKIEYTLDVHVVIPWWPDRRAKYDIPVTLAPGTLSAPDPVVAASSSKRGQDLAIEASFEDRVIVPGQAFAGAVSIHNLRDRKLRGIELSLVALDEAHFDSSMRLAEAHRSTAKVVDGTPEEAASVPFSIRFPEDQIVPAFETSLMGLRHHIELKAIVAWGSDLVVTLPVAVAPAGSKGATSARSARRVPLIGAERRAQVWAELARGGLDFDPETERLSWSVGGVRATVGLESRGAEGLWTVATLRWPALGIELRASDRPWYDLFQVPLAHEGARDRFKVHGREAAQASAFFDGLGGAGLPFEEITFDDDGCIAASPGGGLSHGELADFVGNAIELAQLAEAARWAVPPPVAMAEHLEAWRTWAPKVGGTVHPGAPRIAEATFQGEPIEIETLWEKEGIAGTEVALLRRTSAIDHDDDPPAADPDAMPGLPARVRAVLEPAGRVQADAARLSVRLPGPLWNPASVEPLLAALAEWARALRTTPARGPYR